MKLLKFVYRSFMTGMPLLTYNPISRVPFHAPFNVLPESLYINYKLNSLQFEKLNSHIKKINPKFTLEPIKINIHDNPSYYLSLNIYNCTSPLFLNENGMTRFEINTYVNNGLNRGTLIVDYMSNSLSMDPVNIFKDPIPLSYKSGEIIGKTDNILLNTSLILSKKDPDFLADPDLAKYSDYIYYSNGIYDKLFYDTSLIGAPLKVPKIKNLKFEYLNISYTRPDSIFYFKNKINFVGSVWDNLFKSY